MIALLQRVSEARVEVEGDVVGAIDAGVLAFVAVEPMDGEAQCQRMVDRMLGYRLFSDASDRMNHSLRDTGGGLLLVSQFTLAADTRSGLRPSFSTAATPAQGRIWFDRVVEIARNQWQGVEIGRYGTHMKVHLVNDGPVTFRLEVS